MRRCIPSSLAESAEFCEERDLCLREYWLDELQVASLYSFTLWLEDLAIENVEPKGSALRPMYSAYSILKHLQPLKTLLRMLAMCLLSYPITLSSLIIFVLPSPLPLLAAPQANESEMRCRGREYDFIRKAGRLGSPQKPSYRGLDASFFYRIREGEAVRK